MKSSARIAVASAALLIAACSDKPAQTEPSNVTDSGVESEAAPPADTFVASNTSWHRDVAPILAANCQGCHSTGEIGPFPLTSYAEARAKHALIASAVEQRRMPPWLPASGCQEWRGVRALTDAEIALIKAWSAEGAPEGDPRDAKPATAPPQLEKLEWVDKTVDIGVDYVAKPPPGGLDEWRCFMLDPELAEDRVLVGYDLVPTVRTQVHHAGFVEASVAEMKAKDDATPGPGWPCEGSVGVGAGRVVGAWAAGAGAVAYPPGVGMTLQKGTGLVVQMHYHLHDAMTAALADRTKIHLQYARSATMREARLATTSANVEIPPKVAEHSSSSTLNFPSGGTMYAIQPHMHLFGRKLHVEMSAGGATTCLMDVPRWDYHWEAMYFFKGTTGVNIPAGATVKLTCTWENQTNETIGWAPTLDGEMCDLGMIVTSP